MKTTIKFFAFLFIVSIAISSCKKDEEDEGEEMEIKFKTGAAYTSVNDTIAAGTDVIIGIEAETESDHDPIIKFNISESVNGGANTTVFTHDLEDQEYEYDYAFTLAGASGETQEYTFTITNKDGLNEHIHLTVTVQ